MNEDFFDAVWGDPAWTWPGWGEIRAIRPAPEGGRPSVCSQFVPLGGESARSLLNDVVSDLVSDYDVYFGVVPRLRQGGTAADCDPFTNVLWADVDAKHQTDGTKTTALRRIASELPLQPQIIVDSGGGYHLYWLLDEPDAHERTIPVMRGIAARVGGDNVHDLPRILRVPGTINHKYNNLARVLRIDRTFAYRFSDLRDEYALWPAIPPQRKKLPEGSQPLPLPEAMYPLLETDPGKGKRSEAVFYAMCLLYHLGYDREAMLSIIRAYPDGVGRKMAEMSPRAESRWFDRTYDAVMRKEEAI